VNVRGLTERDAWSSDLSAVFVVSLAFASKQGRSK
jgi:hypothetical protein